MKIAIGCDPNASRLKEILIKTVVELGHEYGDFGSQDPIYANVAFEVAGLVASKKYDRGILLCGTGIGVSIAANKVKGVYAALVSNTYTARKAMTSNKANVICIGSLTTGDGVADEIVKAYLTTEYISGTPSEEKLQKYIEKDLQ